MYSLLDQLILRQLPVRDPQRLVVFHGNFTTPGMYRGSGRNISFSWPKYQDFRDRAKVFNGVAARFPVAATLEYTGAPERVDVELVTGNYFEVLGVRPVVGRVFTDADDQSYGGHPVAVLGYSYWQERFAGDPRIVGQQVRLNGLAMTVVGVSAPSFHSIDRGNDDQVRVPMAMKDTFTPAWKGRTDRFWAWLNIVARIKPGITIRQAEAGANVVYRQILEDETKQLPPNYTHRSEFLSDHLDLRSAATGMVDQMSTRKTFFLELLGISGIVLLIACVNLAGLLLARTEARQRELAIRLAIGAGRWGVIRQLLTESLVLAAIGGALGIALSVALLGPASRFLVDDGNRLVDPHLDWRVLGFALGVTVLTALVFAIAPVLQLRRMELASLLKNESGASSSRGQVRLRKLMVAAQLAFCVWLMIGAGLFARSLGRLRTVDMGFRKEHMITFMMDIGSTSVSTRVIDALRALPGVAAAGVSDYGVLTGGVDVEGVRIQDYTPAPPDTSSQVRCLQITPGYFKALGVPLLAGRDIEPGDMRQPHLAVMVNEAFARTYFRGQSPIGKRLAWTKGNDWFEIVGMVANQHYDGPAGEIRPFLYRPSLWNGSLSFYVRTSQAPEGMLNAVRHAAAQEAPGVPVERLRTMEQFFDVSIDDRTSIAALAGFFGLLATALAAIGLYGVMAYTVSRRTREIGIRMALGAGRGTVMRMVIREVALVIAAGLIAGLPTGLLMARLIRTELFNVSPLDATAAGVAIVVVSAIALLAGFLPARRATSINPMRALRWE
jgi:predicted permease